MTAKPQWQNANLQRSEVVTCSHGCMCMFAICFSNFVPFFLPKIISFCFEACVSTPFAGLIGTQSLFFNNQPKLGISHNLIPFHPKQETPKDSGNPRSAGVGLVGWEMMQGVMCVYVRIYIDTHVIRIYVLYIYICNIYIYTYVIYIHT